MAKELFEVRTVSNEYAYANKRPKVLWHVDGPGGPGPYGTYMSPDMYFDTNGEAKKMMPLLVLAYRAGQDDAKRKIREAIGL